MKKIYLLTIVCLFFYATYAQNSGRGFNFQAVARNAEGIIRAKDTVKLQFSFLPGSSTAAATYTETFTTTTDVYGTFSVMIGSGTPDKIKFNELNFVQNNYWLKIEIWDNNGWQPISNQTLLSVPYSESAYKAGNGAPIGCIMPFSGNYLPENWLWCDGTVLSSTAYPDLYSILKMKWGNTEGSPTFKLPNIPPVYDQNNSSYAKYIILANNPAVYVNPNNTTTYLEISPATNASVKCWSGNLLVNVNSNTNWTVSSSNTAFTVNPTTGVNSKQITITYTENPANDQRSSVITFNTSGITKTFVISQDANSLIEGLAASYTFENNANDVTGHSQNNGIAYNITYVQRNNGKAAQFNGASSNISIPMGNTINFPKGTSFSISVWIKCLNPQNTPIIIDKYAGNSGVIRIEVNQPNLLLFTNIEAGCSAYNLYRNVDNSFYSSYHHLVCVSDRSTGNDYLYIDGQKVETLAAPSCGSQTANVVVNIGVLYSGTTGWYQGEMDNLRFYNRNLSDNEVQLLYQQPN